MEVVEVVTSSDGKTFQHKDNLLFSTGLVKSFMMCVNIDRSKFDLSVVTKSSLETRK